MDCRDHHVVGTALHHFRRRRWSLRLVGAIRLAYWPHNVDDVWNLKAVLILCADHKPDACVNYLFGDLRNPVDAQVRECQPHGFQDLTDATLALRSVKVSW